MLGGRLGGGIDAGDWTRPVWDSAEPDDDAEDKNTHAARPFLKRRSRNLPMGRKSDFSKVRVPRGARCSGH